MKTKTTKNDSTYIYSEEPEKLGQMNIASPRSPQLPLPTNDTYERIMQYIYAMQYTYLIAMLLVFRWCQR